MTQKRLQASSKEGNRETQFDDELTSRLEQTDQEIDGLMREAARTLEELDESIAENAFLDSEISTIMSSNSEEFIIHFIQTVGE